MEKYQDVIIYPKLISDTNLLNKIFSIIEIPDPHPYIRECSIDSYIKYNNWHITEHE